MTDEKWGDLKFMVEQKFGLDEHYSEPYYEQGEAETRVKRGDREILIFTTPAGRMRVERISRPLVLDKKFNYHKGSAGAAQIEYVYSDTEKTQSVQAFREVDGEWQPVETSLPGLG
jgi:hypothetical protein